MRTFLGVDVGSVTTKMVLIDSEQKLLDSLYLRTQGQPTTIVQKGLKVLHERLGPDASIAGVGTTGSGRQLAGVVCGADVVKNEITAHAVAACTLIPEVKTIIEIGGQDSKMILLRQGIVTDFAMNTVCAAGTGSFLDHQAARLNLPIEAFGPTALQAKNPVRIAGRCAVFAESDLIHKQQIGYTLPDLLSGLCEALVRNYLNNVGKGKEILSPVIFQGGVAANQAMKQAFEKALQVKITVPPHYAVMGAFGAALMAQEKIQNTSPTKGTKFRGFQITEQTFNTSTHECNGCPNRCEVVTLKLNDQVLAYWGDRCGKWQTVLGHDPVSRKFAAG